MFQRCNPGPVHARCPSTQHRTHSAEANADSMHSASFTECPREPGLLTAIRMRTASPGPACHSSGDVELTFLGHSFESLGRAFDPILAVVAVGRKQPDDLIGAGGGRSRNVAGSKVDSLSNGIFVLQRPLHHARTPAVLTVPLASAD